MRCPRLKPNSGGASSATADSRAVEHDQVGRLADVDAIVGEPHDACRPMRHHVERLAQAAGVPTWHTFAYRFAMRTSEQSPNGVNGFSTLVTRPIVTRPP